MKVEKESIQDRFKEKDAEIERLKAVVEDLSDHGCAAERMERLKAQSAEIERLNGELLDQTDRRHWLTNENESQTKLIAELNTEIKQLKALLGRAADALEFWMKDLASTEQGYVDAAMRDERLLAELRKVVE